jgi:hypothetical protein
MPLRTFFLSPSLPLSPATYPAHIDRGTKDKSRGETCAVRTRKRARNCLEKAKGEEEGLSLLAAKRVYEVEVKEVDAEADPQEREAQALRERGVRGQVEQQVWIMLRDVDHLRVLLGWLVGEGDDGGVGHGGVGHDAGGGAEGQVVRILKSPLYSAFT